MNGRKDYYGILGVKKDAAEKEIKQAYRRLARRHHPDVNPGDKGAEAKFKEINEAYEVLSAPEKRRQYDQMGEAATFPGFSQGGPSGSFRGSRPFSFDFSEVGGGQGGVGTDFFERLFQDMGVGGRSRPARGGEVPVEVTLEEASSGATRLVATPQGRRLEVKIPPGVTDGSRVRIAVAGNGTGGGDLYLLISLKPHPQFERKGYDLYVEAPVPLTTALLGGETEVPTLKGKVMLKVPPETQNGKQFRLAGLGLPYLDRAGRGDLYARVQVTLPTNLTQREKELVAELKRLRGG